MGPFIECQCEIIQGREAPVLRAFSDVSVDFLFVEQLLQPGP